MNMSTRRRERGLTLIEILLALIVMVLGIVGVLALFPPALDSAKESFEVTQAAILAESVANSLTNAIRFGSYDPASGALTAVFTHDLQYGARNVIYSFQLPRFATDGMTPNKIASSARHHPGGLPPIADVAEQPAFVLGGDPWTAEQLKYNREKSDASDPLDQFAFSFRVSKVNTLRHLLDQMKPDGQRYSEADLDPLCKLYEFQITVFRLIGPRPDPASGTAAESPGKSQPKRPIATITTRVSTK
ncbi:MAG: prepilin-type N-terminal cleavage/methylation domain-containing protein [Planctomycetes bacterium]|nr:prepilin-type N-terminal cleavage/methylation domain-containing protein [Planctomycetota bacterium]